MILGYPYVKNISIHYQSLNKTFKIVIVIVEKKLKEYEGLRTRLRRILHLGRKGSLLA